MRTSLTVLAPTPSPGYVLLLDRNRAVVPDLPAGYVDPLPLLPPPPSSADQTSISHNDNPSHHPNSTQGCCGAADEGKTQRCGPNNWIHINESTTTNCANVPGNQQSPINFQTMGDTAAKLVPMPKDQGAMTFSGHKW